ncbi:hypothetical protein J6590_016667 [Homalodisca vitripennis]|nr:hypothetical protein J6590_016667 [Homalodisca vitripennis]
MSVDNGLLLVDCHPTSELMRCGNPSLNVDPVTDRLVALRTTPRSDLGIPILRGLDRLKPAA